MSIAVYPVTLFGIPMFHSPMNMIMPRLVFSLMFCNNKDCCQVSDRFTIFPIYRFCTLTQSKYYTPYETHLSSEKYYTSDPDLVTFDTNQYGLGVNYTEIFYGCQNLEIWIEEC